MKGLWILSFAALITCAHANAFIVNEMMRLGYARAAGQHIVNYDTNWTPLPALRDVVYRCNTSPDVDFQCVLQTKEDQQNLLGEYWTKFFNNCTFIDPSSLTGLPSFGFVNIPNMTLKQLQNYLSPDHCAAGNPPVPLFNVQTSILTEEKN